MSHLLRKFLNGLVVLFSALVVGCAESVDTDTGDATAVPTNPQRVVSLAPSVTEVLFAVGAGDHVVGVTRYCSYPPEADALPEVGGFLDPNFEMLIALDPDLVVLLTVHDDVVPTLKQMGMPMLVFDHERVDGILDSIIRAGDVFDTSAQAEALVADIRNRMQAVLESVHHNPQPRVLISAGRDYGAGKVTTVYGAGPDEWYDTLLSMAYGENAYQGRARFPELSVEALLRMDPEVVVELAPHLEEQGLTAADVRAEWDHLQELTAVKNGRVHVLTGDYVATPGPRFVHLLEDLAQAIHYPDRENAP